MMRDPTGFGTAQEDEWLAARCRMIHQTGRELALTVGEVNDRTEQARAGTLGRRPRVAEVQLDAAEGCHRTLRSLQNDLQNTLFDTEYELRELRERELSPAELLIEGEYLIRRYRLLRRRARIIDGLLAYLPSVCTLVGICVEHLRRLYDGAELAELLVVPDCTFAMVALEQLAEEERQGA